MCVCVVCVGLQVSRVRASKLPSYSPGGSSSPARTQSADRRPVATTVATTVVRQSYDVAPASDTPPGAGPRRTSHLRPPTTIVSKRRHQSNVADAVVPNGRAADEVVPHPRPQSADSRVELSTSLAGSRSTVTSRQARSRNWRDDAVEPRDEGGQAATAAAASRIVAPRTGVQRHQSRDPTDGTQINGTPN